MNKPYGLHKQNERLASFPTDFATKTGRIFDDFDVRERPVRRPEKCFGQRAVYHTSCLLEHVQLQILNVNKLKNANR